MKVLLLVIKWMAGQARTYIFSLSLIVILQAVSSLLGVGMAIASKSLIDAATGMDGHKAVQSAIIFAVMIIGKVGLNAACSIMSASTTESMANTMRQRLFARLSQTEWMDFSKYHSGDILTRMTSDVKVIVDGIVNVLPGIVSLGVGLTAAFITLLFYDPVLALLAFVLGPVTILFSRFFGKRLKQMHIKIQQSESVYRAFIHESIQNMLIVKAFCLERSSNNTIGRLQDDRFAWVTRRNRMNAAVNALLSLGYWVGYFLAFGWGALRLSQGAATFGTLTAFLQLVEQVQSPFVGLAYTFPQLICVVASSGRIMEFERLELEKNDCKIPDWTDVGVQFHKVSFKYEKNKNIFKNSYVNIPAGEIVAIMAPSGEGKTTFVRLLLSFLRAESGQVYFTNVRGEKFEACAASRRFISYVPQGNTLFSGTIAENLRVACMDATDKELELAARAASAWEFIENLKDGLNTRIGERGLGLSEGQAQRLAIARAFLHRAPILILDEATSALDIKTEKNILMSINNLRPFSTCIIITHRKNVLKICNRVLRLENGLITEYVGQFSEDPATEAV